MSRRSIWESVRCNNLKEEHFHNESLNSIPEHGDVAMEDTTVTWGLISQRLNQQDQLMRRDVRQIRKKWGTAGTLVKRNALQTEKLQRSRNSDIESSLNDMEHTSSSFSRSHTDQPNTTKQRNVSFNQSNHSSYNGSQTSFLDLKSVSAPDSSSTGSDVFYPQRIPSTKRCQAKESHRQNTKGDSSSDQLKKTKSVIRRKTSHLPLRLNRLQNSIPHMNIAQTMNSLKKPIGFLGRMHADTLSSSSGGTRKTSIGLEKKRHLRPPQSSSTVILGDRTESDEVSSKSSSYFLGSGSTPSSISYSDDTSEMRNDALVFENEKLRLEIEQLREENELHLTRKAHQERGKLAKEIELLSLQRQKLEMQLYSPTYYYSQSSPMNWAKGRSGH